MQMVMVQTLLPYILGACSGHCLIEIDIKLEYCTIYQYRHLSNNDLWSTFTSMSTIHTFIGLIYLFAGIIGGSLGTAFALSTRFELGMPGTIFLLIFNN